ncbi:MAG: helix-hairpin-helix domain-containing protein [Myxococcales bacterium]|nr:helix-hairpin-helix domain-containing protein [Myxococcales bacterium]
MMIPTRHGVGALGLLVCALSLAALAQRQPVPATRSGPTARQTTAADRPAPQPAQGRALAALRRGEALQLNCANAAELRLLPGIGPQLAARIVEDRTRSGPFAAVGQLVRVRGIGPAKLAKIEKLLEVAGPPDADCPPGPAQRSKTQETAPEAMK